MFVFAVAILICHYVCGSMGLIATLAQRQTDVAKVLGDEFIQSLDLLLIGISTAHQFSSLGPNLLVRCSPFTLEFVIPVADFRPTLKCRHLNLWWLGFAIIVDISFFLFFPLLVFVNSFETRELPRVDPSVTLLFDRGILARFSLEFYFAGRGNVHLKLFI